jgi:hypothetical protein
MESGDWSMRRLIADKRIPKSLVPALAAVLVGGVGLLATTLLKPRSAPAPPPVAAAPARYVAPRPNTPEFAACDWVEVLGSKLSIWSFACGTVQGDAHLEPDSNLPGFWLATGGQRYPVVRTFPNAPGPDTALKAIRLASPGPATDSCVLAPAPGVDGADKLVLTPTGEAKDRWEREEATGNYSEAPCGALGVDIVGDRYFWPMPGHPELMVFADMGSEIQIFDPSTLRVVGAR